jgi:hypothetical protein
MNDIAPQGYGVYTFPGTIPEFRMFKKQDGTIEQQVRYVNKGVGYTGKWIVVSVVEEQNHGDRSTA